MKRSSHKVNETRTFGIEIEAYNCDMWTLCEALNAAGVACFVEMYNHETRPHHWKIVPDGSIMGSQSFELVSPPLKGQAGLDAIQTVCNVLAQQGAKVNKSCGLHVHHAANDLTLSNWKNLCKYYMKYEETLDSLLPWSRRANNNGTTPDGRYEHQNYCQSLRLNYPTLAEGFAAIDQATDLRSLASILCYQDRYYKLNLMAFWRHGTVEVRHHSGTVEYEKIAAWVSLTQALMTRAIEKNTVSTAGTDLNAVMGTKCYHMAGKVSKSTAAYYVARQAAMAA